MLKLYCKLALLFSLMFLALTFTSAAQALPKGIYITQETMEDTPYITYLIKRAKKVGIDTFVVDLELRSTKYQKNIALLKENNIRYVARIIVFPDGGTREQIMSEKYRDKKYNMIQTAIAYGAQEIQLDYIRYKSSQQASSENTQDIFRLISWYKERLKSQNIPLQVDVFGISSFGESRHIGQSIKVFSQAVDMICPMVYPSHYEPFREHAVTPYKTVFDSLIAVKNQFKNEKMPFKLNPYIELSNYRYPLSEEKKLKYIYAQIQAVEDSGADGWYAWSPHNQYDNLFRVMETYSVK